MGISACGSNRNSLPARFCYVRSQVRRQPRERREPQIKISIVRIVGVRGELLDQPRDIRADSYARSWDAFAADSNAADVADQHLRKDVVVVVADIQAKFFVRL